MVCNYVKTPNRDRHSLSQVVLGGCGGKRWYVVRTKPGYGVAWRVTPGEVESSTDKADGRHGCGVPRTLVRKGLTYPPRARPVPQR